MVFHEFNHEFGSTLSGYSYEGEEWFKLNIPLTATTWKALCYAYLPNPEHAKLRERLLRLEDIHGPGMRKRFRPEEGSVAAKKEQARLPSVSLVSYGIHRGVSLIAHLVISLSVSFVERHLFLYALYLLPHILQFAMTFLTLTILHVFTSCLHIYFLLE